ncbi:MAG: hypothetical protein KC435_12910 [Thermomicrobiales bacterium]|nr:hypothetical protein [Thermomicrobiales bacterium]
MHHMATRAPSVPVMIELADISTPREQAIVARIGKIDHAVIDAAIEARFQAVPVLDSDDRCLGMIDVPHLAQLAAKGEVLTPEHADGGCVRLPHLVPVTSLVSALAESGVILHTSDPHDESFPPDWFGIVSVADLNRPIFRAHVYQMMVILETSLGQLIMDEFGDDWGAIRLLSEGNQKRVREFWEEERDEGVDLSPITTVTLSDLFHIAAESNRVWNLMGFAGPAESRTVAYQINDLRNVIMHPVRPLIVNRKDLMDLDAGLRAVESLTTVLLKRIGMVTG